MEPQRLSGPQHNALVRLFLSLDGPSAFFRFLRMDDATGIVCKAFANNRYPNPVHVSQALDLLEEYGLLTEAFFRRLYMAYPLRFRSIQDAIRGANLPIVLDEAPKDAPMAPR